MKESVRIFRFIVIGTMNALIMALVVWLMMKEMSFDGDFKYGAPPHGGLAYGLDRWVSLFAGLDSIRDCIAFPKNNSGRDVMLDAPSAIDQSQLDELNLIVDLKEGE